MLAGMWYYSEGRFLSAGEAMVPVDDRSFMYGDGLFETIAVCESRLVGLSSHLRRMGEGARFLRIPFDEGLASEVVREFVLRNRLVNGIVRVHLSRGSSTRGLAVVETVCPRLVVTGERGQGWGAIEDADAVALVVVKSVVVDERSPLNRFKTANRLVQILARMEARDSGYYDGILCNGSGRAVETSSANLLWIVDGAVGVVSQAEGALPGVTQRLVGMVCENLGIPTFDSAVRVEELLKAEGVFLTSSGVGVLPVGKIGEARLRSSALVGRIARAYVELMSDPNIEAA